MIHFFFEATSWCANNNTCSKNGVCREGNGTFICDCFPGFTGQRCEEGVFLLPMFELFYLSSNHYLVV